MAAPPLTAAQQQAIQSYLAKYQDWWKTGRTDRASPWGSLQSPGAKAWIALANQLNLPEGYRVAPDGEIQEKAWYDSKWGALGLAGLEAAGMLAGGFAATAAAGGGAGAGAAGAEAGTAGGAAGGGTLASTGFMGAAAGYPSAGAGIASAGLGGATAAGAAGAGTAAASGATAGGGGAFSTFVNGMGGYRGLVGIGTNLLGSYLQSSAANNATDAQLAASREALAMQAQQYNTNTGLNVAQANQNTQAYNTTMANLAPYRGIGASSLSMLGYGLGLPGYENGKGTVVNAPPPITPVQPLAVPPPIGVNGQPGQAIPNQAYIPTNQKTNGQPQMSTGNAWSGGPLPNGQRSMVTLQAPTGEVGQVPSELAQHYIQQGATLLNASSVQSQGAA